MRGTDESGSAVPGATITATEVRTNISRNVVSNEAGNYTFSNLASGMYRVEGELIGFRKFTRENVQVDVNTTVRVDIGLVVGALEESVMVSGEAPMLQTDRTDTGRIIQSEQITRWNIMEFSGHPQANYPRFEASLDFPTEPFSISSISVCRVALRRSP